MANGTLDSLFNEIATCDASSVGDLVAPLARFGTGQALGRFPNLLVAHPYKPGRHVLTAAEAAVLNGAWESRARAMTGQKKEDKNGLVDASAAFDMAATYGGFAEPELPNASDVLVDEIVIDQLYRAKGLKTFGTVDDRAGDRAAFVALSKPASVKKWRAVILAKARELFTEDKGAPGTTETGTGAKGKPSRKGGFDESEDFDEAAQ